MAVEYEMCLRVCVSVCSSVSYGGDELKAIKHAESDQKDAD